MKELADRIFIKQLLVEDGFELPHVILKDMMPINLVRSNGNKMLRVSAGPAQFARPVGKMNDCHGSHENHKYLGIRKLIQCLRGTSTHESICWEHDSELWLAWENHWVFFPCISPFSKEAFGVYVHTSVNQCLVLAGERVTMFL